MRIKWLLSDELGLFAQDKLDGQRFPTVLAELRGQALVGYNQPAHNRYDMPWISYNSFNALYKRVRRLWNDFDEDIQDEINAEIDKSKTVYESKPRALRGVPPIDAAHLVEGVQILLTIYPESRSWREVDRVNALAHWWATTPEKIQKRLDAINFGMEVQDLSDRVAAVFWDSAVLARARIDGELREAHRRVSHAEQTLALEVMNKDVALRRALSAEKALEQLRSELDAERTRAQDAEELLARARGEADETHTASADEIAELRIELQRARTEADRAWQEHAELSDELRVVRERLKVVEDVLASKTATVNAAQGPGREHVVWTGSHEARQAFEAVRELLIRDESLWEARLAGERECTFGERLRMLAQFLPGDITEWRERFGAIEFVTKFTQDCLGAAAFVGYDYNTLQPGDSESLSPHIVHDRIERRVRSARQRVAPGASFSLTWNEVIRSMQPNGPLTQISSYLYYHNAYKELQRYPLLKRMGEPPLPWIHPWPLVCF